MKSLAAWQATRSWPSTLREVMHTTASTQRKGWLNSACRYAVTIASRGSRSRVRWSWLTRPRSYQARALRRAESSSSAWTPRPWTYRKTRRRYRQSLESWRHRSRPSAACQTRVGSSSTHWSLRTRGPLVAKWVTLLLTRRPAMRSSWVSRL